MPGGFSVTTGSGGLMSGYHPAALLRDCELVRRVNEEDGSYESHFSAVIVWRNRFWITQPVQLLLHFEGVQWKWQDVMMRGGDFNVGDRITGVAQGDPLIIRSRP